MQKYQNKSQLPIDKPWKCVIIVCRSKEKGEKENEKNQTGSEINILKLFTASDKPKIIFKLERSKEMEKGIPCFLCGGTIEDGLTNHIEGCKKTQKWDAIAEKIFNKKCTEHNKNNPLTVKDLKRFEEETEKEMVEKAERLQRVSSDLISSLK